MSDITIITAEEGEALAAKYLDTLVTGFATNSFEHQKPMMADEIAWDWSGDVKGSGPNEDFYGVMAGSWQAVVSQFMPSNVFVVTDSAKGIIIVTFEIALVMDGRGAVPITAEQCFQGKNMFELHVNAEHKITMFRGLWDPNNAKMGAAMGNVMAAFGAAK